MNMATKQKIKLCRLCLCHGHILYDIFEENVAEDFAVEDAIEDLLKFRAVSDPNFPWLICSTCLGKLSDFRLFKQQCIECKTAFEIRYFGKEQSNFVNEEELQYVLKTKDTALDEYEEVDAVHADEESGVRTYEDAPPQDTQMHSVEEQEISAVMHELKTEEIDLDEAEFVVVHEWEETMENWNDDLRHHDVQTDRGCDMADGTPHLKGIVKKLDSKNRKNDVADASPVTSDRLRSPKTSRIHRGGRTPSVVISKEARGGMGECVTMQNNRDFHHHNIAKGFETTDVIAEDMGIHFFNEHEMNTLDSESGSHSCLARSDVSPSDEVKSVDFDDRGNLQGMETSLGNKGISSDAGGSVFTETQLCSEQRKESHQMCDMEFISRNKVEKLGLKMFSRKDSLQEETLVGDAGDRPHKCDVCSKSFTQRSNLQGHMLVHTGERSHECDVCSKTFAHKSDLKRHSLIHTGEKPYKCVVCSKTFNQTSSLNNHMALHTGERPYKCDVCSKTFKQKGNLQAHTLIHTGDRPYKCDLCPKAFREKSNLKRHAMIHTGERPHKCDVCSRAFSGKSDLKKHLLIHTSEWRNKCRVCSKAFAMKTDLKHHMSVHAGERPYKCDVCSKTFVQKSYLKTHALIHTGERPHKCDVCSKTFNQTSSLNNHMLIHSGERPYECPVCPKAFKQRGNLQAHMLVHTDERPHKCDVCSKTFRERSNLRRHAVIHSGERPHRCEVCLKKFAQKNDLRKHELIHLGGR